MSDENLINQLFEQLAKETGRSKEDQEKEIDDVDITDSYFGKLLNVFHVYYQRSHGQEGTHMFSDITNPGPSKDISKVETNREMELFYEAVELHEYNPTMDELYKPNQVDDSDYHGDIYALQINGQIEYLCKLLLPLIKYMMRIDWIILDWHIFKIKSEDDDEDNDIDENHTKENKELADEIEHALGTI